MSKVRKDVLPGRIKVTDLKQESNFEDLIA